VNFNNILFICSLIGFNMSGFIIGVWFTVWYHKGKHKG